jgi:hypothetical protein
VLKLLRRGRTSRETGAEGRACPSCGSALREGQDWCLECGAVAPDGATAGRGTWRTAAAIGALSLLLLGGAVVASYAAVTSDPEPRPAPRVVAQVPPVTTPPAATPVPGTPATPTVPTPRPKTDTPSKPAPDTGTTTTQPSTSATPPATSTAPVPAPDAEADPGGSPNGSDATPGATGGATGEDEGPAPFDLRAGDVEIFDPGARPGAEFGRPAAAVDGDPETVWDVVVPADGEDVGVGLIVDLGARRDLGSVTLTTPTAGFDVEVYAVAQGKPAALGDWGRATNARDVRGERRIDLDAVDGRVRRLLLWFTDAGDVEDPRVVVGEVEVRPG